MVRKKINTVLTTLALMTISELALPTSVQSAEAYEYFSYSGDKNEDGIKKFLKFLKDNGLDAKYFDSDRIRVDYDGTVFMLTTKFLKPNTMKFEDGLSYTFKSSLDRIFVKTIYAVKENLSTQQKTKLQALIQKEYKDNFDKVYVTEDFSVVVIEGQVTFVDTLSFNELLHRLYVHVFLKELVTLTLKEYLE